MLVKNIAHFVDVYLFDDDLMDFLHKIHDEIVDENSMHAQNVDDDDANDDRIHFYSMASMYDDDLSVDKR